MNSNKQNTNNSYKDQEFYNVAGAQTLANNYEIYQNPKRKAPIETAERSHKQDFTNTESDPTASADASSGINSNAEEVKSYIHKQFQNNLKYRERANAKTQDIRNYSEIDKPISMLAIFSLVLGVVSIIFDFFAGWVAVIFGIAGIICSVIALVRIKSKGLRGKAFAIAGLCTSIAGLIIILILFFFVLALLSMMF